MTPGQHRRKEMQEEARRLQQANEKVRELQQEVERLRGALQEIRSQANEMDAAGLETRDLWLTAHRALDGGGDEGND